MAQGAQGQDQGIHAATLALIGIVNWSERRAWVPAAPGWCAYWAGWMSEPTPKTPGAGVIWWRRWHWLPGYRSQRDAPARRTAEAAGLARAGWTPAQGPRLREDWHQALEPSLGPLDSLRPSAKGTLVAALVATVTHDQRVTVAEEQALRAICAALQVPRPMLPLSASVPG